MKVYYCFLVVCLISCTRQTRDTGNYYFPVTEFIQEKTDCYVNSNDTADKSFWKMRTIISNNDTFFQTIIFDKDYRITDSTIEVVSHGNSKIKSYIMFDYDTLGHKIKTDCQVVDSNLFRSDQNIGESIIWKLHFKDFRSQKMCELSKTRTLIDTNGDQKIFSDDMKFNLIGSNISYQYTSLMTYKKDFGLISYKMTLPNGIKKDYIFKERK